MPTLTPAFSLKGRGNCGVDIVNECVNTYSARMRYKMVTNDIQFWGVSLNMKYQF